MVGLGLNLGISKAQGGGGGVPPETFNVINGADNVINSADNVVATI